MTLDDKRRKLADIERLGYEKASKSLEYFFRKMWRVVEPRTELMTNWHQGAIAEYLTASRMGQIKRLLINMPPRYTKSNLVSVAFPTWVWIDEPQDRFFCASYSGILATKHSVDRRTVIESPWYQAGYGHRFRLAGDQNMKTQFQNDKRGHMIASGFRGSATGLGGKYIIIDDPHDTTRAASHPMREADVLEYRRKLSNRHDDKATGVTIITMQRLDVGDLSGEVIANEGLVEDGGVWTHLCLPAEAPERTLIQMPVSGIPIVREAGDILHPEREDKAALERQKKSMGTKTYAGQYDQDPAPTGGTIFDPNHWRRYGRIPDPARGDWGGAPHPSKWDDSFIICDTALEGGKKSDFVVIQAWCRVGVDCYLLDQVRGRMDYVATERAYVSFVAKWAKWIRARGVEKKSNGHAILSRLKRKIPGLIAIDPKTDSKEQRASAASPSVEAGNAWIPDEDACDWIGDFVLEHQRFGNGGKNDDQVDCTVYALLRLNPDKKDAGQLAKATGMGSLSKVSLWKGHG